MKRLVLLHSGLIACVVAGGIACWADDNANFGSTRGAVGWVTSNEFETPFNQLITPAGTQVDLPGIRPNALALSPDGTLLVTSGLKAELLVLDPATGNILQRVPMPSDKQLPGISALSSEILGANLKDKLSFTGLVFSPDGKRIYLSNVNGDVKVFGVGAENKVSPLFSIPLPFANMPGRNEDIPTGIAVSRDGLKIYVALNVANRLAEIDAVTGKVFRTWDVGVAPFGVALADQKIYVSNWGGRRPDSNSLAGPIGRNGVVRVDGRSIANEGSVSIIHLESGSDSATTEVLTGQRACAIALTPSGKYVVCANAGDDTLSVIDTHTDKIVETIIVRQKPGDPFGAQPNALAFDRHGKELFVCNGSQNAVAVFQFKPGESKLLGLIPVGWFPGSIAYDARRGQVDVANMIAGARAMEAVPKSKADGGTKGFNSRQYGGSLSLIPLPSRRQLEKFTQTALANLRYPVLAQAALPARENRSPVPVPERVGEPSVIQHVLYIIKENRTYDQVFGDVKQGNGEADLCIFGERVTPNLHKLVNDFVLLDNTYCCGIISSEGHQWSDSAFANDYVQRSYAGWPRSYPGGGSSPNGCDALAYSSAGFIWDDAISHGKTVFDFGEFTTGNHIWKESQKKENQWLDAYHDFVGRSNSIVYSCAPDLESLRPFVMSNYIGFDLTVPDVYRASQFIKALGQFEKSGTMPNLMVLWLPNDHTSGTKFGEPKPEAQVADNDLAYGRIVEAVTHSRFWTNTCIFSIEDDPQDGWDHVSGYRTTAMVISPFAKRHAVVGTQYNTTSLLRTIELMLGLPPMNQMDATATPMFDCFTSTPDFAPFDPVPNQVALDEMNPSPRRISDAVLRKDALVSARLPLDKEDQCPEDVFNRILWRAVKGSQTPYPVWATRSGDDD
ncbi:MAG TPA: bifunctional YncE family protein/alkaline phosphatase family protein [Verrucomicrobiae bacterium]|jgi:YVTN family beta-propeller protein